jgi:hypothetical protein
MAFKVPHGVFIKMKQGTWHAGVLAMQLLYAQQPACSCVCTFVAALIHPVLAYGCQQLSFLLHGMVPGSLQR